MTRQTIMLSDISLLRLIISRVNFIAQDGNISLLHLSLIVKTLNSKILRVEIAIELLRLYLGGGGKIALYKY